MFNPIKLPIGKSALGSWAKIIDDIIKVAIITLPAVVYGGGTLVFKVVNSIVLILIIYVLMCASREIHQRLEDK